MKILVLGASGMLGHKVSEELIAIYGKEKDDKKVCIPCSEVK